MDYERKGAKRAKESRDHGERRRQGYHSLPLLNRLYCTCTCIARILAAPVHQFHYTVILNSESGVRFRRSQDSFGIQRNSGVIPWLRFRRIWPVRSCIYLVRASPSFYLSFLLYQTIKSFYHTFHQVAV